MAKKTNKLTTEEATIEVYRLFCRGLNRDYIIEFAKRQKWGLRERALADVIEKATERLIQTAKVLNLDTEVGKALERLESLYKKADEAGNVKSALAVQREINSVLGLGERARRVKTPPTATSQSAARPRLQIAS